MDLEGAEQWRQQLAMIKSSSPVLVNPVKFNFDFKSFIALSDQEENSFSDRSSQQHSNSASWWWFWAVFLVIIYGIYAVFVYYYAATLTKPGASIILLVAGFLSFIILPLCMLSMWK